MVWLSQGALFGFAAFAAAHFLRPCAVWLDVLVFVLVVKQHHRMLQQSVGRCVPPTFALAHSDPCSGMQLDVETVAGSIQAGKIPDMRGPGRAPSQARWVQRLFAVGWDL